MFNAANLALFVAIVRAGSFAAAAQRLGLTTTKVSRRLAELEDSLGVRLLNRTTRSLSLTDAGRRYLEDVAPIVEAIERANRAVTRTRQEVEGRLRITAPQLVGELLVMDWVLDFQRRYPRVAVDLELDNYFANLPATGIDLAFRVGPLADSSLVARHLFDSQLRLVATHEYLASVDCPVDPQGLESLDAIITARDPGPVTWTFTKKGKECRLHPRGRLRVNDLRRALQAVQSNHGLALLPELLVGPLLKQGKLEELLPDWSVPVIPIHLVYSSRRLLTLAQQAFIDFVCMPKHGRQ
ncbi:MAG: LysR family transcriptional regulator [Pseudomonadota bacterium]